MTPALAIRIVAVVLALVLAVAAGIVVPTILDTRGGLPTNDWIGLRSAPTTGVLARCSLGTARAVDGGTSVWSAVTGEASLDIIQVGARALPGGRRQIFAAWGRGEPHAPGSLYRELDLGPVDGGLHKYTVQLLGGAWSLSVDGVTRARIPDTFRTWPLRAVQVAHETEGILDPLGGVRCERARSLGTGWTTPAWTLFGSGAKAATAPIDFGADWFAV